MSGSLTSLKAYQGVRPSAKPLKGERRYDVLQLAMDGNYRDAMDACRRFGNDDDKAWHTYACIGRATDTFLKDVFVFEFLTCQLLT